MEKELVDTWEDFDKELERELVKIMETERRLAHAKENLREWTYQVIEHLRATVGERDKK